jgi:hypothetical protein
MAFNEPLGKKFGAICGYADGEEVGNWMNGWIGGGEWEEKKG